MNTGRPADTFASQPGMKPTYTNESSRPLDQKPLPLLGKLPHGARSTIVSMLGEFVGTFLFLFFAFAATQVANMAVGPAVGPNLGALLYISLAFGFSLAINVWVFFRISGGLFNPAVTLAMALVGVIGPVKASILAIAQILGAIAAAAVVSGLFPGLPLFRTTLNPTTSVVRGLFIEMFLTALLIFTIFMLVAERHKATFLAPIGIGLALFVAELAGVYFTGGSLNPARSFGPEVAARSFARHHWIYWVGPLLGSLLALLFYRLVKALEYETANPDPNADPVNPQFVDASTHSAAHNNLAHSHVGHAHGPRTDGANDSEMTTPMKSPIVTKSSPTTQASKYGTDGTYSRSSLEHPRPRALHRHSSRDRHNTVNSRRSREEDTERSFRRGPEAESGSAS